MSTQETDTPNVGGRPEIEIDLDELRRICRISPTFEEIAAVLGCSTKTIQRRYATDEAIREIIEAGRAAFRAKQRRAFAAAVDRVAEGGTERGDSTLVIFLAKQRADLGGLGFRDRHEHDVRAEVRSWSDLVAAEAAGEGAPLAGELEGDGGNETDPAE